MNLENCIEKNFHVLNMKSGLARFRPCEVQFKKTDSRVPK